MPTNEAGLPGGPDQGDGERNAGIADQMGGGRAGLVPDEATRGQQPGAQSDSDMTDGGHLGRGGDPAEGRSDPAATGRGPGD